MSERGGMDEMLTELAGVLRFMEEHREDSQVMDFVWGRAQNLHEVHGKPVFSSFASAIDEYYAFERNNM